MRMETLLNAAQKAHARNIMTEQAIKQIQAAMRPLNAETVATRRSLGIYGVALEAQLFRASAKTYRQAVRFDYELRRRIRLAGRQAAIILVDALPGVAGERPAAGGAE